MNLKARVFVKKVSLKGLSQTVVLQDGLAKAEELERFAEIEVLNTE